MQKSTEQKNNYNNLIKYCCGDHKINWSLQYTNAKKLLDKYSYDTIIYAINYYKNNGIELTSLGFFIYANFKNMAVPASLYNAEKQMAMNGGTSSDRNQQRLRESDKTDYRKESYFDMFEE